MDRPDDLSDVQLESEVKAQQKGLVWDIVDLFTGSKWEKRGKRAGTRDEERTLVENEAKEEQKMRQRR